MEKKTKIKQISSRMAKEYDEAVYTSLFIQLTCWIFIFILIALNIEYILRDDGLEEDEHGFNNEKKNIYQYFVLCW